jgi:hypothetical protein
MLESSKTLANYLFLVDLLNLTFDRELSRKRDSNVKFDPLGYGHINEADLAAEMARSREEARKERACCPVKRADDARRSHFHRPSDLAVQAIRCVAEGLKMNHISCAFASSTWPGQSKPNRLHL